jgi:hypothetical protein
MSEIALYDVSIDVVPGPYFAEHGIQLTTFDSESELHKMKAARLDEVPGFQVGHNSYYWPRHPTHCDRLPPSPPYRLSLTPMLQDLADIARHVIQNKLEP